MGLKRFVRRTVPTLNAIDTVKNMVDEGSPIKGLKKTIKENVCEDNPLTSLIYKAGKTDGKKEGYAEASDEYEKKLLEQADYFIQQQKVYAKEQEAYDQLMDEYEAAIEELNGKLERTEQENQLLQALLIRERQLHKIKTA